VPPALQSIVALFHGRSDSERRELLLHYAAAFPRYAPGRDEVFDVTDLRHDAECADEVGVYLRVQEGHCVFRVSAGPEVQTLTRALAAILCEGLAGAAPSEVLELPDAVVEAITGSVLVRLRNRTIFYILGRMKDAVVQSTASPAVRS
jgi:cysteine desulfuration protein SufE